MFKAIYDWLLETRPCPNYALVMVAIGLLSIAALCIFYKDGEM